MSELIAEARVLVTPDTTNFRTLLIAKTTAAAKGVTVPVTVTPVVTGTAAASQAASSAGVKAAAASIAQVTANSASAAQAQAQLARAADILAVAERRAAASLSEVGAAQIRYQATISASQATLQAFRTALAGTDVLLLKQATSALQAAKGNEALALSNLEVARSEAAKTAALTRGTSAQAASFAQTSRGAGAAALSMVGLRGATLAATGPFLAGAVAVTAFAKSVQLATSFNSEIAVLGAVTGATGVELERAAEAAREFGRDITLPGVTAGDAAKTITEFSKAGLDLNDSIAATRGGLQLAQAAQLDYADAVELTANALNAFNLSGDQAVHVADTLANAANLAQGGIGDTALALRQAAAAAEVVGVTFEDTSALLTLLARNGLTGSDAGTSLRTAFLRLVNPSKKAADVLESLNVSLRDMEGNVRPEIFAEFAKAQENLSVATQQSNAAIVFGQDAFRAFGILGKEGTGGLDEVRIGLEETGTAARVAGARMTGLAGAQENLSNQLSSLGETIGQIAIPPLTFFVDELARMAENSAEGIDEIKKLGQGIANAFDQLPKVPTGDDGDSQSVAGFIKDRFTIEPGESGNVLQNIVAFATGARDTFEGASRDVRVAGVGLRQAILDASQGPPRGQMENVGTTLKEALQRAAGIAVGGIDEFGARVAGAFQPAFDEINAAIRAASATTQGIVQGIDLGLDLAVARAEGDEGAELAILRQQEQRQEEFLDAVLGRERTDKNIALAKDAAANLERTRNDITAIVEGNAADAQRARDEQERIAKDDQAAAERTFLGGQEDARARQERLVGLASETEGLQDDIRRRQGLRVLITAQIRAIRESALSEKAKQEAIKALAAEKQKTSDQINALTRQQAQNNREQAEAAQEEREAANIALGESILDLTGNKNPLLRAIDAAIRDAIRTRNQAKKGSVEATKAQTEINNLLKRRKDILEDVEKERGDGTSVLELLQQNAETFNRTGGNLVTGNQPFAGPTGFTADVAQFLHRGPQGQVATVEMKPGKTPIEINDDRLVRALERVAEALEGEGGDNGSGGTLSDRAVNALGQRGAAMARFYNSRQARQLTEAEN